MRPIHRTRRAKTALTGRTPRLGFEHLEDRRMMAGLVLDSYIHAAGDPGRVVASSAAVDAAGNQYMSGFMYEGQIDFDLTASHAGNADILTPTSPGRNGFVAKYNPSGEFLWVTPMRDDGTDNFWSSKVRADDFGNSYIAGSFQGAVQLGSFSLTSSGGTDGFFAKLDSAGEFQWVRQNGGEADDNGGLLSVNSQLETITQAIITRDPSTIELAQFDFDGNSLWSATLVGSANIQGIDHDSAGNLVFAGSFRGTLDLDPGPSEYLVEGPDLNSTTRNSYVVKLTSSGEFMWGAAFEVDASVNPNSSFLTSDMTLGPDDVVAIVGKVTGTVDVDPGTASHVVQASEESIVSFVKFDTNGNFIAGNELLDNAGANSATIEIAATADGYILAGMTPGTAPFVPSPGLSIPATGSPDIFILELALDGEVLSAATLGNNNIDYPVELLTDAAGGVYLAAWLGAGTNIDLNPDPNLSTSISNSVGIDAYMLKLKPIRPGDQVVLLEDDFEVGEWNGLWVEDSQNDWFRSSQRSTDGNHSAEVDGSATNATLTTANVVNLSQMESATLTFDWLIESGFDKGEYLALDIYNGSSWINDVRRLNGNQSAEDIWLSETVDLTPYMSSTTQIRFRAKVSAADEDANVDNVRIVGIATGPNTVPVADAGGPYAMNEGGSVTLSGSASTDTDGTIVSYQWDLDGDGQYDDATGSTAVFSSTQDGPHVVGLRVTDNRGASSTDTAAITVANVAPTAHAGGPYAGFVGQNVILTAAGSTDPGNDIASYEWDLDSDGEFDDATGASVVFTATTPASYAVSVRVTDDDGASSTASATVAISDVPTEVVLFQDSFESGQWNGRWVQDSQNDWFTSTQRKTDGNYSAEVDGLANNATLTMSTPIDLSGYASAALTFDWLIEKGFDAGEYLALDVFNGTTWINDVRRLNGDVDAEDIWHAESVDLAAFASTSLRIRFRSTVSDAKEDANVDNVRIVGSGGGSLAAVSLGTGPATVAHTSTRLGTTRSTGLRETDFVPTTSVGTIVEMMAKTSSTKFLATRRAVVDAAFAEFGSSIDGPRFAAALESQFGRDLW